MTCEEKYLGLLQDILDTGIERKTRNSKTLSLFGKRLEFDISNSFPLLTTKKMYWKGILHELLWFLKGSTNAKELHDNKVKIWDGNTTREYLDSIGLKHYPEFCCGPIYGFQWRHFNTKYIPGQHISFYKNKGIDQLQNCIDLIKNNPTSRRIFMSAWNPEQMKEMCLPPCHVSYQFYVNNGKLSCQMYQRSGDLFLGVPFNIASTALLTYILADLTNLKPEKIIIVIGDAHIYNNHIDAVKVQLDRKPYNFPKLEIENKAILDIEDYTPSNFKIIDYKFHKRIPAKMVV